MSLAKRRVRWAGVGVSCVVSVGLGLALVFRVVTPETLSRVQTPELLAMMGLLVMPGIAAWAIHTERRVRLGKARQAELAAAETARTTPAPAPSLMTELKPAAVSPWLSQRPAARAPAVPAAATPAVSSAASREHEFVRAMPGRHADTTVAGASVPSRPGTHASAPVRTPRGRRPGRATLHTGSER